MTVAVWASLGMILRCLSGALAMLTGWGWRLAWEGGRGRVLAWGEVFTVVAVVREKVNDEER